MRCFSLHFLECNGYSFHQDRTVFSCVVFHCIFIQFWFTCVLIHWKCCIIMAWRTWIFFGEKMHYNVHYSYESATWGATSRRSPTKSECQEMTFSSLKAFENPYIARDCFSSQNRWKQALFYLEDLIFEKWKVIGDFRVIRGKSYSRLHNIFSNGLKKLRTSMIK